MRGNGPCVESSSCETFNIKSTDFIVWSGRRVNDVGPGRAMTLKELRSISRARDKVPPIQTILNSGGDNQRASAGSRYRFVGSILQQKGRTKNTKSEAFPRKFIMWCRAFTIESQSIKNNRIYLCFSQDEHSSIFIGASKTMRSDRWISESEKGASMTAMRPKAASRRTGARQLPATKGRF